MEKQKRKLSLSQKGLSRMVLSLFLGTVLILNVAVYLLANRFSWYFYTETQYTHKIGTALSEKMEATRHPVNVRFCMDPDEMLSDVVYSLIYKTAEQYAEMYPDKIQIGKTLNVYTDYKEVSAYREKTGQGLHRMSVIFESDLDCRVLEFSDFFLLDSEGSITDYNGEEMFGAMCLWVQTAAEERKKAYYTVDHGENYQLSACFTQMVLSGYELSPLHLAEGEVPEDASFVFISNPIYDFERSSDIATEKAELDYLGEYLDRGGCLLVTLNGAAESYRELTFLRAFLATYGIGTGDDLVYDYRNTVNQNGKTVTALLGTGGGAADVASSVAAISGGRMLTRENAVMYAISDNEKSASVSALLQSADTAVAGEETGVFDLCLLAETASGGCIVASGGGYLFYDDLLNRNAYQNEAFLYTILARFGCETTPAGCTLLPIAGERLENLTIRECDIYFTVLGIVLPLLCIAGGAAVTLFRRRR